MGFDHPIPTIVPVIVTAFSLLLLAEYRRVKRGVHLDKYILVKIGNNLEEVNAHIEAERQETTLATLWTQTEKHLDYYHTVLITQARQSFRNTQLAMCIGFMLPVAAGILALTNSNSTKSLASASLGVMGSASALYLGRTFIRSQDAAASHLRGYFNHPRQLSRFLVAERLIEKLGEGERDAALNQLIKSVIESSHDAAAEAPGNTKPPRRRRRRAPDQIDGSTVPQEQTSQ
jgi:hypothetical protein